MFRAIRIFIHAHDRDRGLERRHGKRLGEVVDRADLDGTHRLFDGRVGGKQNDRDVVAVFADHAKQLEPRHARHGVIGDEEVHAPRFQLLKGGEDRADGHGSVPQFLEERGENRVGARFVVEAEDSGHEGVRIGEPTLSGLIN